MSSTEQAIRDWVASVLDGVTVIFSHPDATRPARPYATVQVLSDRRVGHPDTLVPDEEGEDGLFTHEATSQRRGTFSVSIYADNHQDLAEALELSLDDPEHSPGDVVIVGPTGGAEYNQVNRSTSFEGFSVLDFEFARTATRETRTPVIENVEVTA